MQTPFKVAAAAFFRPECAHAQLFESEYKRSNRTKGLKILRCFPHCCPDHIDRSYCGTSLSVRVELQSSSETKSEPSPSTDFLAVFARFEALSEVSLKPGECVQVDKIKNGTQTESNPDAQWIPGVPDRPSKLVTPILATETPSEERKPLVFHFNSKVYARWYYDWESGANKAQRLMKHALKAYVVERCAVDTDGNFVAPTDSNAQTQLYRVLHVVTSPEFTVISYRRASSEPNQGVLPSPRDTPQHSFLGNVMPEYVRAYPNGRESEGLIESDHSPSHLFDTTRASPPRSGYDPAYNKGHHAKRQRMYVRPSRSLENSGLLEDKLRWEHVNSRTVAVSRNLALLYSFLRWTPLNVYGSFADELVHILHHNLKEALSGFPNQISRLNCFSKLIFDQVGADQATTVASSFIHGSRIPNGPPSALPHKLGVLLYALAQATLWLFSTETREWIHAFFMKHADSVLDKYALRASFIMFVRQLEDCLNQQVFERSELRSVDNAAEQVIAAVFSYDYFHVRRPHVREMLSGPNFAGWNGFVAQMREAYISLSSVPRARRQPTLNFGGAEPARNSVEDGWNAEWLLDVDEAVWKFSEAVTNGSVDMSQVVHAGDDDGSVSLLSLLEVISMMARLEVTIDTRARTLHARSLLGLAEPLDCLRVVMDGKERVFSMFPNGMASGVTFGAYGDYVADMQVDHSERLVVYLQFFKWSVREDGSSYYVRMRIECWRSRRLCISGDVLVTTAPASFTLEEVPYLGEMSLRNKRDAVDRSFSQQTRVNPSAKWAESDAAPWKELGRFRLSYLKA